MAILSISRIWSYSPSIVSLDTTYDYATLTATNFLLLNSPVLAELNNGEWGWKANDFIVCTYIETGVVSTALFTVNADFTTLIPQTVLAAGVNTLTGTPNQVIVSNPTGNVTLSLPQSIATTSSPTFGGLTLTIPLDTESGGLGLDASGLTDGYLLRADGAGGFNAVELIEGTNVTIDNTSSGITINASGGGGGSGTVTSIVVGTGLTGTPSTITTTGTIALTVPVAVTSGGTGLTSTNINRILYSSANNTIAEIATANNSVLATNGSGVPSLTTTLPSAVQISVGSLNSGTGASSTTFYRGDGVWGTPPGIGTVTSITAGVGLSGGTITSSGTIDLVVPVSAANGGTGVINSGTLTYSGSASVTGANTGDQNLFSNIPVSGQTTVTANSATTALTFVAGSNMTITTDNTAKSITFAATVTGSGTVNSGTANQLAYYATSGTAVSGLASGNNGALVTNGSGVPSISSTLPNAVQDNISRLGTITSIGAPLGAAFGGTGLSSITAHNFIIGNGTGTPALLAPSATVGVPVVSQGASADPVYGTALVVGGGTGRASATAYAVICGGTTSTGTQQSVAALGSSGDVLTSNGAGALPTFQTPVATTGQTIYTKFTASGTWTKNANTKYMMVYMWGAGSGGGSGRFGTINLSTGGLGGNCGSVIVLSGPSAFFNATETVTVGAGGTGAAAQTSAGTDGIAGGTGGATLFGSITTGTASGGRAGSSTTVSAGNNGRLFGAYGVANVGNINGNATVSVGNAAGSVGGNGNLFLLPGGGGAGGPGQSSGTSTGGNGSVLTNYDGSTLVNGAPGGLLATPTGTNGTSAPVIANGEGVVTGGMGAGGGWGEDNGSGVVGAGGNGGTPGGGGGGGGGSTTVSSGAGGNGGRGEVWVIEFTG